MMEKLIVALGLGLYIGWKLGKGRGYSAAVDELAKFMVESVNLGDPGEGEDWVEGQRRAGREGLQ